MMKSYSVTVSHGRTSTVDMVADSLTDVQSLFRSLSNADVRTIKEVQYVNPSPEDKNGNFYRELKILICNKEAKLNQFITVRFAKALRSKQAIIDRCKQYLTVNGKRVDHVCNVIKHT